MPDRHKNDATDTIERNSGEYTLYTHRGNKLSTRVSSSMIDDKNTHPSLHALIGHGFEISIKGLSALSYDHAHLRAVTS